MKDELKKKLTLSALMVILTLGLVEASYRCFDIPASETTYLPPKPLNEFLTPSQLQTIQGEIRHEAKLHTPSFEKEVSAKADAQGIDYSMKYGGPPFPTQSYRSIARIKGDRTLLYDAWIHQDALGRRLVTGFNLKGRKGVAFLGDSFVYGEGLNDQETLPSIFQRLNPSLSVFNLGIPGAGPNDILLNLTMPYSPFFNNIDTKKGTIYYIFMSFHPARAHCSLANYYHPHLAYRLNKPLYSLEADGALSLQGTCRSAARRDLLFRLLSHSEFVRKNRLDWPLPSSTYARELVTKIILKVKDEALKKMNANNFVVVAYPDISGISATYLPYFRQAGLSVFDFTRFDIGSATLLNPYIPGDFHPSHAAAIVMAHLIQWQKNEPPKANQ